MPISAAWRKQEGQTYFCRIDRHSCLLKRSGVLAQFAGQIAFGEQMLPLLILIHTSGYRQDCREEQFVGALHWLLVGKDRYSISPYTDEHVADEMFQARELRTRTNGRHVHVAKYLPDSDLKLFRFQAHTIHPLPGSCQPALK